MVSSAGGDTSAPSLISSVPASAPGGVGQQQVAGGMYLPHSDVNVDKFMHITRDDLAATSPASSVFTDNIHSVKTCIGLLDENLESDKANLQLLRKAVKTVHRSGHTFMSDILTYAEALNRIGESIALNNGHSEKDIATSFFKFALLAKDIASNLNTMLKGVHNILLQPLDTFLKCDLKNAGTRSDLRKPVDKAWKDYENKVSKCREERRKREFSISSSKTESLRPSQGPAPPLPAAVSPSEDERDLHKGKRFLQLHLSEYLLKLTDIGGRRGTVLLDQLVQLYDVQLTFFSSSKSRLEEMREYISEADIKLASKNRELREKRSQLDTLRQDIKRNIAASNTSTLTLSSVNRSGGQDSYHQHEVNRKFGTEIEGALLKKSDGTLRKVWQKRKVRVHHGFFMIFHSQANREPVKLNLLTCSIKENPEDGSSNKEFCIIPEHGQRKYFFMAESEAEKRRWVSVMRNSKEQSFAAFSGSSPPAGAGAASANGNQDDVMNNSLHELTSAIIADIRNDPDNYYCADCRAPHPEWVSTNKGVMICIACSGCHRELGVHVSRIQSLTLDRLSTADLLLPRFLGNKAFNRVYEALLESSDHPINGDSSRNERSEFIRAKYEKRAFVARLDEPSRVALFDEQTVSEAMQSGDLETLLRVAVSYTPQDELNGGGGGGGTHNQRSLSTSSLQQWQQIPHPGQLLQLAIQLCDSSNIQVMELLIHSLPSSALNYQEPSSGDTALHVACREDRIDCARLLLRAHAKTDIENNEEETAKMVAESYGQESFAQLIHLANQGERNMCQNVYAHWMLTSPPIYSSEEELDDNSSALLSGTVTSNAGTSVSRNRLNSKSLHPDRAAETGGAFSLPNPKAPLKGRTSMAASSSNSAASVVSHRRNKSAIDASVLNDLEEIGDVPTKLADHPVLAPWKESSRPRSHTTSLARGVAIRPNLHQRHSWVSPSEISPSLGERNRMTGTARRSSTEFKRHSRDTSPPPRRDMRLDGGTNFTVYNFADISSVRSNTASVSSSSAVSEPTTNHVARRPSNQMSATGDQSSHRMADEVTNRRTQGDMFSNGRRKHSPPKSSVSQDNLSTAQLDRASSKPGSGGGAMQTGVSRAPSTPAMIRVQALFDCVADYDDELSFSAGDIIIVKSNTNDPEWWFGVLERDPSKNGLFPKNFVSKLGTTDTLM